MSEAADRGVEPEVTANGDAVGALRSRLSRRDERRTFLVPVPDGPEPSPTSEVSLLEDAAGLPEFVDATELDDPALRLRELTEIERMRDLEIARLEQELAEKSATIFDLETALFHAERRGNDLDRRWNDLAALYEETASALVETGARLEAVHRQTSYRLMLSLGRAIQQRPSVYRQLQRLTERIVGDGLR